MKNIFYVSKANSIPFADRDISNYKTEENTLSFEGKQVLSKKAIWNFQPNDNPPIQIKSNLSNIKAKIYKKDVFQEEIEAVLKIENLNQNITLDCEVVHLQESANFGLIFTTGNIYNNATDLNVLDTYNLIGSLPDFAITDKNIIGKTILVDGIECTIISHIYDEVLNTWCIEVENETITSGEKVMSIDYDIENYNIYEIPFDFEQYNNSDLYILLQANNDYETFYKISELLKIGFFERQIEEGKINEITNKEEIKEIISNFENNTNYFWFIFNEPHYLYKWQWALKLISRESVDYVKKIVIGNLTADDIEYYKDPIDAMKMIKTSSYNAIIGKCISPLLHESGGDL